MSLFSKVINRAGAADSAALPSAVPKGFTGMLRRAAALEEDQAAPLRRAEEEEQAVPLRRAEEEEKADVQAIRRVEEEEDVQALRRTEEEEDAPAAPLRRAEEEESDVQAIRRAAEEDEAHPLRHAEEEEQAAPLRRAEQEEEADVAALRRQDAPEEDAPIARAMDEPEPLGDIPDMRALRRDAAGAVPQVIAEINGPAADSQGWQQPDPVSFDPAPQPMTPVEPAPFSDQRPKVVIDQIDVVIHDDTPAKSQGPSHEIASLSRMLNSRYLRGL